MTTENPKSPDLWERQRGESTQAFEGKWLYIRLGQSRSIRQVARQMSRSQSQVSGWSKRWEWVRTAEAWEIEQDRVRVEEARRVMAEKARAEAEKWARRADKLPDMMFLVCADTYRDLVEARKAAKSDDPAQKVEIPHKGILVRSFVATAPLAERALEMASRRNRVTDATGTNTPTPEGATQGALNALRAYQETQDALAPVEPDPSDEIDFPGT